MILVISSGASSCGALSIIGSMPKGANRMHTACSLAPKSVESHSTGFKRKRRKSTKRNQLRKKQNSPSSSYEPHFIINERDDVDEWLIRSTQMILGDS